MPKQQRLAAARAVEHSHGARRMSLSREAPPGVALPNAVTTRRGSRGPPTVTPSDPTVSVVEYDLLPSCGCLLSQVDRASLRT